MKLELNNITSGYASTDAINTNNTLIENAIENTLSRDGSTPNVMESDLDMNGNRIINQLAQAGDGFIWEGVWITATYYALNMLVQDSGSSYICKVAHTAGAVFATDLAANKWELLAQKGNPGAGSGDMLISNNLSELTATQATARGNIGAAKSGANTDITSIVANVTGNVTGNATTATNATNATNLIGSGAIPATTTGGEGLTPTNASHANTADTASNADNANAVSNNIITAAKILSVTAGASYGTDCGGGSTVSVSFVEIVNSRISVAGSYRISFKLNSTDTNAVHGKIYKNGSALGTDRTVSNTTPTQYTEDFTLAAGDTIQIYAYRTASATAVVTHLKFGTSNATSGFIGIQPLEVGDR